MARPPSIAVIIPLYRHEHYIAETLASVTNQSLLPECILVLDDGSPDHSLEAARAAASRSSRIEVHTQENQGAHHALNSLVAMATKKGCELCAILNSDDRFHPQRLEKTAAHLHANPGAQVVCTSLRLIDDHGKKLDDYHSRARWFQAVWSWRERYEKGEVTLSEWLGLANFLATTSNVVARTDYLKAHPFRNYRYAHDYYFLAEAALREELTLLPEPLVDYRVHEKNTISTAPEKLTSEILRVHLDLLRSLAPDLDKDPALRQRTAQYFHNAWQNVSALRMDLFTTVCAQLAAGYSDEEFAAGLETISADHFPELTAFPNKDLVNTHREGHVLGSDSGLISRFEERNSELKEAKAQLKALRDLERLRREISGSSWLALGRFIFRGKAWTTNAGKTPREKRERLREALHRSMWYRFGRTCGLIRDLLAE